MPLSSNGPLSPDSLNSVKLSKTRSREEQGGGKGGKAMLLVSPQSIIDDLHNGTYRDLSCFSLKLTAGI